ncbi:restriction endonuclease subunit S [Sulfurimonas hydrogeniphila]|uniref:restriction endonuclease subunit S n=1 Tax=Sulfurimonas hydrogeniphila TaxID=2509341 RepID=UPI00125FF9B7|nr:restriction endonuclease subunit S [Sulfurimonas hydrogeniphila]
MSKIEKVPKLRFPEFSGEWEVKKIEDIFEFKNGINKEKEFFGKGFPIINFKDVYHQYELNKNNILGLVESSEKEQKNFSAKKGDVFFTRTSETILDIGMSAVLMEEIEGCVFSGFVLRARPIHNVLLDSFKKYCFSIQSVRKEIVIKSSFTTRALTSGTLLNKVIFKYPFINEQQKIASFLTAVDIKIEQLTKKEELLQEYKKGVMQKIFSQEIRFKDDSGNSYPDWEEKRLEEFLILTLREVPKPQEKYLALGVRSHCKGTFQRPESDPKKISMDKLYKVKENDLIVSITFAWESAIAMAKKEDEGGLVSHRFPTYTFKRDIVLHEYFKYVIIQKRFRYMLDLISPGGAGRNRVMSKKEFVKLKWSLPSVQEQQKIASFLSSIDSKIEQVNKQLNQAKQFKKALLQQMFV